MSRTLNPVHRALIVGLTALAALSGCGQNSAPSPATTPEGPNAPAGVPEGSTAPVNDPVWHASGGTSTLNSPPPEKNKPEDLSQVKPDLKMTPQELYDAFKKDSARLQYKVVEITGVVDSYDCSSDGSGELILRGPGIYKFGCGEYPMAKAMPGQTVTIRSRWQEYVGFARWVIVRVEGDPPPTITAERLVADVKADQKGKAARIGKGYLVVTGTIRKIDEESYCVYLTEPGTRPEISCCLGALGWQAAEKGKWLEVGKPVRILGSPSIFGGVSLSSAVILPPNP